MLMKFPRLLGLLLLATLVLAVSKLEQLQPIAEWSWWRILVPLWVPWLLMVVLLVLSVALRFAKGGRSS